MRASVLALAVMVLVLHLTNALAAGGGDIVFAPPNADPVRFSHDFHLKQRGLKCAACHFRQFAKASAGYEMKKDTITKDGFCVHCHNGMKAFDLSSDKNCTRCHKK